MGPSLDRLDEVRRRLECVIAHASELTDPILPHDARVPGTPYLTLDAGLWPG